MTATGTRFPWAVTALATNNIRLDGVHIDVQLVDARFDSCPAGLGGQSLTVTGSTSSGGSWLPATNELTLTNAEGLFSHSASAGTTPITTRSTFRDLAGTLRLDH
jgi:hypothetical protein